MNSTQFHVVAGLELVDAMEAEKKARVPQTGRGYESEALCRLQGEHSRRGILGVEIVCSIHGHSIRYDSGIQGFGLLASSRELGGTLEAAEAWAKRWVSQDPARRYAWKRKQTAA